MVFSDTAILSHHHFTEPYVETDGMKKSTPAIEFRFSIVRVRLERIRD